MLKIRVDDVLQSKNFSSNQLKAFEIKSPFEWFKEATEKWQDYPLVLAVVAEGIGAGNREWVDYIKARPKWAVQCHGAYHENYKHLSSETITRSLVWAKKEIEKAFDQEVTEFYPPKMAYSEHTQKAVELAGLVEVRERFMPQHWLEDRSISAIYFHYWNAGNLKLMEKVWLALQENS